MSYAPHKLNPYPAASPYAGSCVTCARPVEGHPPDPTPPRASWGPTRFIDQAGCKCPAGPDRLVRDDAFDRFCPIHEPRFTGFEEPMSAPVYDSARRFFLGGEA